MPKKAGMEAWKKKRRIEYLEKKKYRFYIFCEGKQTEVFYSFHYDRDVMRVQQIRNIGMIEGNQPVSANQWETVKKSGKKK